MELTVFNKKFLEYNVKEILVNCDEDACRTICKRIIKYINSLGRSNYSTCFKGNKIELISINYENMSEWSSTYSSWKSLAKELLKINYLWNGVQMERERGFYNLGGTSFYITKYAYRFNKGAKDLFSKQEMVKMGISGIYSSMIVLDLMDYLIKKFDDYSNYRLFVKDLEKAVLKSLGHAKDIESIAWCLGNDVRSIYKQVGYDENITGLLKEVLNESKVYVKVYSKGDNLYLVSDNNELCVLDSKGNLVKGNTKYVNSFLGLLNYLSAKDYDLDSISITKDYIGKSYISEISKGSMIYDMVII